MSTHIIRDDQGNYTAHSVPPEEIINLATSILKDRVLSGEPLTNSIDTNNYLALRFSGFEHEVFACLFLDNKHRVIALKEMFRGTISGASVYPREVVKAALKHNAAAVIFTHNHPSGDPSPSASDREITARLKQALDLIDVRVLDHVIIGGADSYSFAEKGLI